MLKDGGLDLMIVIGGYNSSNTQALARMCAPRVRTFYIDNPACIEDTSIRHRQVGAVVESRSDGWLPAGPATLGITAGASTPDSVIGEVLERILAMRGCTAADLVAPSAAVAGAPLIGIYSMFKAQMYLVSQAKYKQVVDLKGKTLGLNKETLK